MKPPRQKVANLCLYFDGSSQYNIINGPAGCGWALFEGTNYDEIACGQEHLKSNTTCTDTEWLGLYHGLKFISSQGISCDTLYVRGDAKRIIDQLNGVSHHMCARSRIHYKNITQLMPHVSAKEIKFVHIPRIENKTADKLAKQARQQAKSYAMFC